MTRPAFGAVADPLASYALAMDKAGATWGFSWEWYNDVIERRRLAREAMR